MFIISYIQEIVGFLKGNRVGYSNCLLYFAWVWPCYISHSVYDWQITKEWSGKPGAADRRWWATGVSIIGSRLSSSRLLLYTQHKEKNKGSTQETPGGRNKRNEGQEILLNRDTDWICTHCTTVGLRLNKKTQWKQHVVTDTLGLRDKGSSTKSGFPWESWLEKH